MDFLQMMNAVLGQTGFLKRTSVADSGDPDDVQLVEIANEVAEEILEFYDWSSLVDTFTVNIVPGQSRYPLPDDYGSLVADSAWESDGSRKVDMPVPRNRWFMYKFSSLTDAGTIRARLYGDEIELHDPSSGTAFDLEYIKNTAITDPADVPKARFSKDSDKFLLSDKLLIRGVKARWAATKMMPQAQKWEEEFMDDMRYHVGKDNSGQTIGGTGPRIDRRSPYYPLYRKTP